MVSRTTNVPEASFFLLGPRGTGKYDGRAGFEIRDSAAFHRFLEAASFSQGAVLNMQTVAKESVVNSAAIETLLFQTLRAENATHDLQYTIHFWRTREGVEVDFVLYGERGLHAFELKRSSVLRDADLAGLRMFCSDYPMAKGHLHYGGQSRYQYGNIEVVPLEEGLKRLGETLA